MTKKISIWTAAGQFFAMIEKENELLEKTDQGILDLFPLSDYQNGVSSNLSNEIRNLQILSCPTVLNDCADYEAQKLRKAKSCPVQMSISVPMRMVSSPISTSIDSIKLNKATEEMIAFWRMAETSKKRSIPTLIFMDALLPLNHNQSMMAIEQRAASPAVPSIFGKFEEIFEEKQIDSFFEKMNGFFSEREESFSSLFQRLKMFFDTYPSIFSEVSEVSEEPSFFEAFANYFSEGLESNLKVKRIPFHHKPNCMCFKCWRNAENSSEKVWKSENGVAPNLPVFVKSPVDSLKLYKCAANSSDDDDSSDSERESVTCGCSTLDSLSSTIYASSKKKKQQEINDGQTQTSDELDLMNDREKLRKAVKIQQEIIQKCLELNKLFQ